MNCNLTTSCVEKLFILLWFFLGWKSVLGFFCALTQTFVSFHSLGITKTDQAFPSFFFWFLDVCQVSEGSQSVQLFISGSIISENPYCFFCIFVQFYCILLKRRSGIHRILGYSSITNVYSYAGLLCLHQHNITLAFLILAAKCRIGIFVITYYNPTSLIPKLLYVAWSPSLCTQLPFSFWCVGSFTCFEFQQCSDINSSWQGYVKQSPAKSCWHFYWRQHLFYSFWQKIHLTTCCTLSSVLSC